MISQALVKISKGVVHISPILVTLLRHPCFPEAQTSYYCQGNLSAALSDQSKALFDLKGVSDPMDTFPLEKRATRCKRRSVRSNWIRFPLKKRDSIQTEGCPIQLDTFPLEKWASTRRPFTRPCGFYAVPACVEVERASPLQTRSHKS